MHLRRLVISGFKSFGSKTTLELAPGITAVVGPNGSGKSNVADAIRWVFGEQSLKLLRAKKSEDLIFAGTKSRKSGSMAEASLEFDNSDGGLDIPHSEIVLTRRLYRSGENEYLINRKKVRLIDIVELLARSQVSQSNYTVIGQGMVDQFITLSPKERKELLDDAVGVKQYYLRRDQAQRKLTSTKSNLEQASAIVRELEPHLKHLRRIAKRAEEREAIAENLRELQTAFYAGLLKEQRADKDQKDQSEKASRLEFNSLASRLSELEAQYSDMTSGSNEDRLFELRNLLETQRKEREELRYRLAGVEAKRETIGAQSDSAVQTTGLKSHLRSVENELDEVQSQLKQHEQNSERYGSQALQLNKATEETSQAITQLETELAEIASQPHDLRALLSQAVTAQGRLIEKMKKATQLAEMEELVGQFEDSVQRLAAALHDENPVDKTHLPKLEKLRAKLAVQSEQVSNARAEALGSEGLVRQAQQQLSRLQRNRDEIQGQIASAEASVKSSSGSSGELDREIKQLHVDLETKQKELGRVEEELARLERESRESQQRSVSVREEIGKLTTRREALQQRLTEDQIQLARINTRLDDLTSEIDRELGGGGVSEAEKSSPLLEAERSGAPREIERLKVRLAAVGEVDAETLQDLQESEDRHSFLTTQIADLEKASADLGDVVTKLDTMIKKDFHEGFEKIATQFAKYFETLFDGGKARIELTTDQEGELGIEVSATPPGKRLSSIATLSGGEKSLTSVALLCAFLRINPSPFIVLDEVDAALDEANTRRFASIIRDLGKKTQFILITHNRRSMELADVLYGVTMGDDHASAVVSVRLDEVLPSKGTPK